MSRDEYIMTLRDKGLLHQGIQCGAISLNHARDASIRGKYAKAKKNIGHVKAVSELAYEYRLTERRIEQIVR